MEEHKNSFYKSFLQSKKDKLIWKINENIFYFIFINYFIMDLIFTFLLRFSVIKVRIKGDMQEDFNKSNCRHIRKRMDVN